MHIITEFKFLVSHNKVPYSLNAFAVTIILWMKVIAAIIITMITAYSIKPIIPIIAITRSLSARSPIPIPCNFTPKDSALERV